MENSDFILITILKEKGRKAGKRGWDGMHKNYQPDSF